MTLLEYCCGPTRRPSSSHHNVFALRRLAADSRGRFLFIAGWAGRPGSLFVRAGRCDWIRVPDHVTDYNTFFLSNSMRAAYAQAAFRNRRQVDAIYFSYELGKFRGIIGAELYRPSCTLILGISSDPADKCRWAGRQH